MRVTRMLRERLTLLAPTRVEDDSGGWTDTYADVGKVAGRVTAPTQITSPRADEIPVGGQARVTELVVITLDTSRHDVETDYRIRAGGRDYEIVGLSRQGDVAFATGRAV